MLSDPICALATVPGRSAVAVVRLAGTGAFEIARRVLRLNEVDPLPADRRASRATWYNEHGPIDTGLVVFFAGPASYCGEDTVEFSGHGGLLGVAQLLAALEAAGARAAGPGEFTRRALERGKIDLLQAEAIADLIDATTPRQGRMALHQLEGGLSRRIETLRSDLVGLLALLSYDLDFPEEDDGPIEASRIAAALDQVVEGLDRLLATGPIGVRLRSGALVVFAGRPNVGKSSLFNALLGEERVLVTEVPGTTRDAVEVPAALDGWPIRLADTAGLRDSEDQVERMGIEVSRRYLGAADLVLLCVEAGRPLDEEELRLARTHPTLVVRTKVDLQQSDGLGVSARTGEGLARLRAAMRERLFAVGQTGDGLEAMLTQERHKLQAERARAYLEEARAEQPRGEPAIVAHLVQGAVAALDALIGNVDVEEVLDQVFSRFCVGK